MFELKVQMNLYINLMAPQLSCYSVIKQVSFSNVLGSLQYPDLMVHRHTVHLKGMRCNTHLSTLANGLDFGP